MRARRASAVPSRRGRGVALVEPVVAMLLGLVLLAGAVTVFMQSTRSARTAAPVSRLEETLRAAFERLEPDIRMANYWGLTNRADRVTNVATPASGRTAIDALVGNSCGVNWTADLTRYIDARRHGDYDLTCPASRPAPWSDVLIVRRASARRSAPRAGTIQLQTNRQAGAIFADGIVPPGLGAAPRSETHDLLVNAYYVGAAAPGPDGVPQWALYRQALAEDAGGRPRIVNSIVARGIAELRVQFGVDTDGDGNADVYVDPGAAELAGGRVVSVKLRLAALADHPETGAAGPSPSAPGEHRRRIVLEKTIALRNAPGS
jgi:type IV pilus assembly protein PilW